jgi:hypothetical protein
MPSIAGFLTFKSHKLAKVGIQSVFKSISLFTEFSNKLSFQLIIVGNLRPP